MTGKPEPGPLKYKVTASEEAPAPTRVALPPPKKVRPSHRDALFRALIVLVILVSIAVAYWSVVKWLLPLQQQSRLLVTKVSNMSEQLDQKERRWTREQINEIRARYQEVQRQLFADPAALEEWLRQLHTEAAPLALDLKVRLGQSAPQAANTNTLSIVTASISLDVLPDPGEPKGKSPYERVLAFGQQLAAYGKRADLAELTVAGGPLSISSAVLVLNLWAGDLGGEPPLSNANHDAK